MIVAIIPARSGSARVKDKNIRPLAGHPLMAYSIQAAIDSAIFGHIYCATDSEEYAGIAGDYGAEVPFLRAPSGPLEPDYAWLEPFCRQLWENGVQMAYVALLRPTSPFRGAQSVLRAYDMLRSDSVAHSIRSVSPARTSPYKTWWMSESRLSPIMDDCWDTGWHSTPTQGHPQSYEQNAGLEILRTKTLWDEKTICGTEIIPFVSPWPEGLDINSERDFEYAEWLVETGRAKLPEIR